MLVVRNVASGGDADPYYLAVTKRGDANATAGHFAVLEVDARGNVERRRSVAPDELPSVYDDARRLEREVYVDRRHSGDDGARLAGAALPLFVEMHPALRSGLAWMQRLLRALDDDDLRRMRALASVAADDGGGGGGVVARGVRTHSSTTQMDGFRQTRFAMRDERGLTIDRCDAIGEDEWWLVVLRAVYAALDDLQASLVVGTPFRELTRQFAEAVALAADDARLVETTAIVNGIGYRCCNPLPADGVVEADDVFKLVAHAYRDGAPDNACLVCRVAFPIPAGAAGAGAGEGAAAAATMATVDNGSTSAESDDGSSVDGSTESVDASTASDDGDGSATASRTREEGAQTAAAAARERPIRPTGDDRAWLREGGGSA
jgi:hypothetical protein